ncbi:MAG: ABC transporter ATP-binding protein, partial [Deltaproteobacteria bacterium]
EGNGRVSEYVGGYDDWLRQSQPINAVHAVSPKVEVKKVEPSPQKKKQRKLSFKEQKELDTLPKRIEELDAEQRQILATMADPVFYRESGKKVSVYKARHEVLEKELAEVYKRWDELEAVKG